MTNPTRPKRTSKNVRHMARVKDNAQVVDEAIVKNRAVIEGNATVRDRALVQHDARVGDDADVAHDAVVEGSADVFGQSMVHDFAYVGQGGEVGGTCHVKGRAVILTGPYMEGTINESPPQAVIGRFIAGLAEGKIIGVPANARLTAWETYHLGHWRRHLETMEYKTAEEFYAAREQEALDDAVEDALNTDERFAEATTEGPAPGASPDDQADQPTVTMTDGRTVPMTKIEARARQAQNVAQIQKRRPVA